MLIHYYGWIYNFKHFLNDYGTQLCLNHCNTEKKRFKTEIEDWNHNDDDCGMHNAKCIIWNADNDDDVGGVVEWKKNGK